MTKVKVVGIAGSFNRPSKTLSLVKYVADVIGLHRDIDARSYDLTDVGPSLGHAARRKDLDRQAQANIEDIVDADILLVGSPTFKGSYPGLFKHLFDLIDPPELRAKPVVLLATGGGDRHALIVEHQLRPLFGFFAARTLPTAIYASQADFADDAVLPNRLFPRFDDLLADVTSIFPPSIRPAEARRRVQA